MALEKLTDNDELRHVGSTDQLYSVRRLTLNEGAAAGLRLIEVKTAAGLAALFTEGRALDLYELRFRGINIGFMSKNGLTAGPTQSVAGDFVRTWPAGFLATCGLRNVGPDCTVDGEYHPLHGRIGGMAAERVGIEVDDSSRCLVISGQMHESALFGGHLVLRRRIEIALDGASIIWRDQVRNQAAEDEPLFLLYHFNFGYPFLCAKTQLYFPPETVLPRDEQARPGLAEYDQVIGPTDGYAEQVFFHQPLADNPPQAEVRLVNPQLGIKVRLGYDTSELPILAQWKSMRSTDYALGIEPGTSHIRGRAAELADGYDYRVPGFGAREFNLRLDLD